MMTAIMGVWYLRVTKPNSDGMWLLLDAAKMVREDWKMMPLQRPNFFICILALLIAQYYILKK
jgi:hypothetical protein